MRFLFFNCFYIGNKSLQEIPCAEMASLFLKLLPEFDWDETRKISSIGKKINSCPTYHKSAKDLIVFCRKEMNYIMNGEA